MGRIAGRVYSGSGGGGGPPSGAAGGALQGTYPNPQLLTRRTPDATALISWRLDELTANHPNSGNGGALDLTEGGTAFSGGTGLMGSCMTFGDGGTGQLVTPVTAIAPTPGAFTIIEWVYLQAFDVAGTLFAKSYRAAAWAAPFASLYMVEHDALGNWDFYASFAGVLTGPVTAGITTGKGRIPLNQWTMLAVTYDKAVAGGTVKQYTNGSLSLSTAGFGGVDVDYGANGPYSLGLVPFALVNPMHGAVDEIRLLNGVMSAADLNTYYRRFVNLSDT